MKRILSDKKQQDIREMRNTQPPAFSEKGLSFYTKKNFFIVLLSACCFFILQTELVGYCQNGKIPSDKEFNIAQEIKAGLPANNLAGKDSYAINVKDYGARGNGIDDDTEAIQHAVDTIKTKGRGTLFFPAGIYFVTKTIRITNSNTVLQGAGHNVSVIMRKTDFGSTFLFDINKSYINLCGVDKLGFSNNAPTPCTHGAEIEITGGVDFILSNLRIQGASFRGIIFNGCNSVSLNNAFIQLTKSYLNGRYGVALLKRPQGYPGTPGSCCLIRIVNCEIDTPWLPRTNNSRPAAMQAGIYAETADGLEVLGGRIGGSHEANILLNSIAPGLFISHVVISGVFLDFTPGSALKTQGAPGIILRGITVTGCPVIQGGAESNQAISLSGSTSDVTISSNRFTSWRNNTVAIDGAASNIIIANNILTDYDMGSNDGSAVATLKSFRGSNIIISNNIMYNARPTGIGVTLSGGSNIAVRGNTITGNKGGIVIDNAATGYAVQNNTLVKNKLFSIDEKTAARSRNVGGNLVQ